MKIPQTIQSLIESFERLPGIGPKSAQRLTFYLLHVPQHELDRFAEAVKNLKTNTTLCKICLNVDETDPCSICSDPQRDQSIVCVVEQPLDVLALEKSGKYKGVYHVLHGKIDPLNNIGPDEIYIGQLLNRVKSNVILSEAKPGTRRYLAKDLPALPAGRDSSAASQNDNKKQVIKEIILATNPTMEGEATAMYIAKQLQTTNYKLRTTRIGRGLPVGADLEYADPTTLERAMEGRMEY